MPKRFHKPGTTIAKDMIEVGDVIRFSLWREPEKFSVGLVAKIEDVGGLKERHFLNEAGVVLNHYPDQVQEATVIALAPYAPDEYDKRKDAKMAEFERLATGTTFVRMVDDDVVIHTKIGDVSWTELSLYENGEQGFEYTYDDQLFDELYDGKNFPHPVQ